jgi:serpin B
MRLFPRLIKSIALLIVGMSLAMAGCARASEPGEELTPEMTRPEVSQKAIPTDFVLIRSEVQRDTTPDVSETKLSELALGNKLFAFDLYQALRDEQGNLFYSPLSISTALAMIYAGARGETERQMAQTLHFVLPQDQLHPAFNALDLKLNRRDWDSDEEETFTLAVANSLWGQIDFQYSPAYLDLIAENYGAGLRLVDFTQEAHREGARLAINAWVSDQTQGKIEDLIQEGMLTELTRLVLANAIYFKAEWERPFLNGTKDGKFRLLNGDQITVQMMSRRAETNYTEGEGYQAVELPYKGGDVQMLVLLPDQGEFEAFERSLNEELVQETLQRLARTDVKLFMPRFAYESSFSLADTLAGMGMPDPFDETRADFSGITVNPTPRLFIKHVLHKAFVAVDEMGTEAAAATAEIAEIVSMPVTVEVDRPFIFVIVDRENDIILFLGRVLDPTA